MAQLKDTVVAGSLRVTDTIYGDTIRLTAISAPTSSNGTTYGPGTNGYVIKSNGTSVYWASIGNASGYSVKDSTANSALGTGTGLTTERAVYYGLVTVNNASQTRATGIYAPTSAGTANQILVSSGGTSAPTWKATASGAAYATSTNGALTFGTLPVAQGGTGATTAAAARTNLGLGSVSTLNYGTDTTKYLRNDGNWSTLPTATTSTAGIIQIGTEATNAAAGNHNHDSTYVKKTGDTMSASLTITKAGECGVEVNNAQTTNPNQVAFIVGSSGNGGIYSRKHSKWIVYADANGNVVLNGNANTATKFSSNASITLSGDTTGSSSSVKDWAIATTTSKLTYQSQLTTQEEIDNFLTASKFQAATFKTTDANNANMGSNDGMIISIPWASTTYGAQLAFDDSTAGVMKFRGKSTNWGDWKTVLHDGNYTTYTVTKTGSGASGTWGISITGNASTATNVAWSGVTDKPTTSVSWSAGTSAGPNLTVAAAGSSASATIPIATADASGIVTNGNQTFGGNKIFKGHVYPDATRTYTLGTSSSYWKGAYIYAGGTIHEANIYWGGSGGDMTTIYDTIDNNRGITAFRYPSYNFGNKTFGLSAESVTIEYTTNSGSSWAAVTDAWYSDDRKRNLFNYNDVQIPVGNLPKYDYGSSATTQAATVGMGVRIIADFEHENRIFQMSTIETYWRIYCCTCTCTIEMFDDYNDTWTVLWTGSYNNVDTRRYYHFGTDKVCDGARVNRAGRFHKLRWTIVVTAVGTSNVRYVPALGAINVYGIGVPTFSTGTVTPTGGTATVFKHGSRFAWAMARWNTPIYVENYNKGGLGTARIPTTDLYIGDDMKYSAANTEKWSTLILGNEQNISDENVHSQGRICIYSAATKAHFIYGASTTTNYSHYLPNANGWIATGGNGSSSGAGDATHPVFLSTAGVLTACSGTLSLNAQSATKTGISTIWMYPESGNEINFGGSNANTTLYFGHRAKDSRDIPAKFIFGGSTGTADLQVKTVYLGSGTSSYISSTEYTGNAATATKATQDNDGNQIDKSYLKRFAWWNANDSHDVDSLGNGMTFAYAAHNAPTTGTIVAFSCYNDAAYSFQLQSTFSNSDTLYYRSKNGDNDAWNTWKRVWLEGNSITSAVWNDYAEYRISDCNEPGKVVFEKGDDTLSETNQRLQHFAGVISDTWGFAQGKTKYAKTPLAVAGRVLVYPYRDRKEYHPGDCVCAAPNGTVDIMTREEIALYPDRIVGIVSMVPSYEEWGGGDRPPVKVNNRIWIKVR